MKRNWIAAVAIIAFLAGLGLLLYPTVSSAWNRRRSAKTVAAYTELAAAIDPAVYEKMLADAEDYNRSLPLEPEYVLTGTRLAQYQQLLDADGTGMMGYIDIPRIGVSLPIYHGTDEAVLQAAVGHLEWTSLPVGGSGTHCVLSGHRGLPNATLFTDLDQLEPGDTFTLHVLSRALTYTVREILVVEPGDTQALNIVPGEDLCTLMTCTPYGINTHRLLVRGTRTEGD